MKVQVSVCVRHCFLRKVIQSGLLGMIPPGVDASMENVHKILEELAAVWRNEQPNFAWLVEK